MGMGNRATQHLTTVGTHRRRRQAQRGAALMYALVAALIISLIILGVGRLVAAHAGVEEASRGYARAIHIAEAAANWKLNQMSRTDLPGVASGLSWRRAFDGTQDHYVGTLPSADLGVPFDGNAEVWVYQDDSYTNVWQPPGNFVLYANGTDPATGSKRGIYFQGKGTGLADRYVLFGANTGANSLMFTGNPSCYISGGIIGSNGQITTDNPSHLPTAALNRFGGCRLCGSSASLSFASYASSQGWDTPHLPDLCRWPSIDDVCKTIWGGDAASLASSNDDATQISYLRDGIYVPGTFNKLTPTEFDQSNATDSSGNPLHIIKLTANYGPAATHHNLFYFTNIQMRSNDILVLDLEQPPPTSTYPPSAIHILIDNSSLLNSEVLITNLAYYDAQIGSDRPIPAFLWYNNTNKPIRFAPTLSSWSEPHLSGLHPYQYTLIPQGFSNPVVRGLVYGVKTWPPPSDASGDIIVNGTTTLPIGVNALVGNHVTLNGNVTANAAIVEGTSDPYRYVLYYRISAFYYETIAQMSGVYPNPSSRWGSSPYGYGHYTP